MIRRPPRSTLFPYNDALPISAARPASEVAEPTRYPTRDRQRQLVLHHIVRSHRPGAAHRDRDRSEEHTSELQSLAYLVCRLLLEKKKTKSSSNQIDRSVTRNT